MYIDVLNVVIDEDWVVIGKKLLVLLMMVKMKDIKVSIIDLESGFMYWDNKLKGFFWFDYCIVDGKYGIIIDIYIMFGNVYDS